MSGTRWLHPRRLLDAAGVLGLVALAVTVVASVALTRTYRPGQWQVAAPVGEGWLVLHTAAAAIAGMAAFAFLLVLVWPTGRAARWRRPAPTVAAAVATLACAAAIVTRDMVGWDLLGLSEVTVGTGLSGYWAAAFDDRVQMVMVDGDPVGQGTYARSLAVHLVSPVVAAAALVVARWSVGRTEIRPTTERANAPLQPMSQSGGSST